MTGKSSDKTWAQEWILFLDILGNFKRDPRQLDRAALVFFLAFDLLFLLQKITILLWFTIITRALQIIGL